MSKSMKNRITINESMDLDPAEDYPFRKSLLKVARCGMCKHTSKQNCGGDGWLVTKCLKGFQLRYPLIACEHDCKQYKYEPHIIEKIPTLSTVLGKKEQILIFTGLMDKLKECEDCANNFYGYCDGIQWYPFKIKEGKCEFFRDKKLTCKYAIPFMQYGTTIRNNYCTKPPEERDGDQKRGWEWCCHSAHSRNIESHKCYEPKGSE